MNGPNTKDRERVEEGERGVGGRGVDGEGSGGLEWEGYLIG